MAACDDDALVLLQGELVALASTFGDHHEGSTTCDHIRLTLDINEDSYPTYLDSSSSVEAIGLPLRLQIRIDPDMCGGGTMAVSYIQFTLTIDIGKDYPKIPDMSVTVEQPKGLDCATESRIRDRLVKHLQEEVLAADMHGCGASIVPMVFYAVDIAQEYNVPHGSCAFCLEDVENAGTGAVTKVEPCFHCFHSSCFQSWYAWKQAAFQSRVQELHGEHNNNSVIISKAMEEQGILESVEHPGQYVVSCPCCRSKIDGTVPINTALEHNIDRLPDTDTYSVRNLPVPLRESIEKLQQQFSRLLTIQKEHNGLIEKHQ